MFLPGFQLGLRLAERSVLLPQPYGQTLLFRFEPDSLLVVMSALVLQSLPCFVALEFAAAGGTLFLAADFVACFELGAQQLQIARAGGQSLARIIAGRCRALDQLFALSFLRLRLLRL